MMVIPAHISAPNSGSEAPQTYGDIVFQPDALPAHVAQTPLSAQQKDQLLHYDEDQPLLFVGHYWRRGRLTLIQPNLAFGLQRRDVW